MRKSIFAKIGAAAVVLTLVTSSLVGGTFAKYTSSTAGTAKATVAKWAVAFKDSKDAALVKDFSLDLVNTNDDAKTTENMIAPGSKGQIVLSIDGTGSQVGYSYKIEADTSKLGGVPVVFYEDSKMETPVTKTGDTFEISKGDVALDKVGTPVTATVYWAWDSTSEDADDTTLGTAETQVVGTIGLTFTAEQLVTNTTPTP